MLTWVVWNNSQIIALSFKVSWSILAMSGLVVLLENSAHKFRWVFWLIFQNFPVQRRRKKMGFLGKNDSLLFLTGKISGTFNVLKPTPVNWLNTKAMDEPFLRNSANSIRNLGIRISHFLRKYGRHWIEGGDCLAKTQGSAKSYDYVSGLRPARCWKANDRVSGR